MARSSGWMRIKFLFHSVFWTPRKSASRIVARCSGVKKTLRNGGRNQNVCQTFPVCALGLHSALRLSRVLAYAFCMRYVLGFDGGGTKTECVLMGAAGDKVDCCLVQASGA